MPTPATVLLSCPPGRTDGDELRKLVASAGFVVTDHALGSAPAVDFDPIVVALVDAGTRADVAAAQTRRWRAELGDQIVPVLWIAPPELGAAGLDSGADVVLAPPLDPGTFVAQLRALARTKSTAARVAVRATEARLLGDQLKKALAQLEREQEMARRVRATFLPRSFPQIGGARFHVCYRPRGRSGGDFYNVQRLDEHHVGFLVGDVGGTGAAAGGLLGTFVLRSVVMKEITGQSYRIVPPDEVLGTVNRLLVGLSADDLPLVAMLAGVLNAKTGTLTVARAGLPVPVYVPASGGPDVWAVPGPFLGTADTTYQARSATLNPGDRLLIGTDGMRPTGDPGPGGPDRLLEVVSKHSAAAGADFVDTVARELLQHVRHADDFTLLGIEMT
ncbi:SpoIIE family protein phosphatase [Gemmata sp. G18]|uniref:SpoIIE family protein phosphatase n=1 Tax=Gemmata palustris TaxID=2822762 RepID=A0ABS5BNN8_9BACT|nr:SpoIIE family protein phosphatase [Gemmata palustris]MBP3955292.1 SpoIIE family protein phosphatase [Gemmata palustris]